MNKFSILILAATLTFSPFALANPDSTMGMGMGNHCQRHGSSLMKDFDKNGDGFIDKEEAQAMHDKHFDEMDTNHDGKISKEEFMACQHTGMHSRSSRAFMGADKDNDGTLDREEAKKMPRVSKNFDAIDTDKDGTIDRNELHKFMMEQKSK